MYFIKMILIWFFGLTCGLLMASWLIASERIGDAIVLVYLSSSAALVLLAAIIVLVLRHNRTKSRNHPH